MSLSMLSAHLSLRVSCCMASGRVHGDAGTGMNASRPARCVIDKYVPHFGQKIAYLRKIDPFVFEELLLEGFERRGFEVIRNRRYTGDGGLMAV